jgi:hypothetical protein
MIIIPEAAIMVGHEERRVEIKTGLEEIKVTESEANQGKIEAAEKPYKSAQSVRAAHVLTALQGRASDVVRGVPKGPTFEKKRRPRLERNNGIRGRDKTISCRWEARELSTRPSGRP